MNKSSLNSIMWLFRLLGQKFSLLCNFRDFWCSLFSSFFKTEKNRTLYCGKIKSISREFLEKLPQRRLELFSRKLIFLSKSKQFLGTNKNSCSSQLYEFSERRFFEIFLNFVACFHCRKKFLLRPLFFPFSSHIPIDTTADRGKKNFRYLHEMENRKRTCEQ